MWLDGLLERRLLVVSGKGGVGKSVVSAALALAAREEGRRVLLLEIAGTEAGRHPIGRMEPGTRPSEVRPGIFAARLDASLVMEDYVRETVRVGLLVRRVLESPIYQRFFAAAPGLKELMTLGKVMILEEAKQGWSRKPLYDTVIVDAPATGHGLSFLGVPGAAAQAIPVGPVGHNARRIVTLLKDRQRTALVVVAAPEEMAVVEGLELQRRAEDESGIATAGLVLNGVHERRFDAGEEAAVLRLTAAGAGGRLASDVPLPAALLAARRQIRRRKLSRFYEGRLQKATDQPLVSLPWLFREELGEAELALLAARLRAA
jgi:anion-transporting  ArsA/GET3 family ATPase